MRAIFGADPADAGEIVLDGAARRPAPTRKAMKRAGLGYTPENRKEVGLVQMLSTHDNLCLASLDRHRRPRRASPARTRDSRSWPGRSAMLGDQGAGPDAAGAPRCRAATSRRSSSATGSTPRRKVMFFDEPSRGVDVQAKRQIFDIIWRQAERGLASIFVSSELEELLEVADRILVMRHGRIVAEVMPGHDHPYRALPAVHGRTLRHDRRHGRRCRGAGRGATALKIYPMELILLVLVVLLVCDRARLRDARQPAERAAHRLDAGHHRLRHDGGHHLGRDRPVGRAPAWRSPAASSPGSAGALRRSLGGSVAAVSLGIVAAVAVGFVIGMFDRQDAGNGSTCRASSPRWPCSPRCAAFANLITGGFPLDHLPDWFELPRRRLPLGIPFPVYVFLLTFVGMHFLMNYTRFGRAVYAVGGNMEAARLSGIDVCGVKTARSAITGVLTAVSGTLIASQIGSGTGTTATGMELDVIAAVIIGGTCLFGGKGRIWGTLLGVLFLGCISNGMTLLNVTEYWQYVVRGGIILGAVLLNQVLEQEAR